MYRSTVRDGPNLRCSDADAWRAQCPRRNGRFEHSGKTAVEVGSSIGMISMYRPGLRRGG
eukprot:374548-Hanusia_phi.AAC.1